MTAETLRVMLVDDHEVVREGLKSLVESMEELVVVAHGCRRHSPACAMRQTHWP